MTKKYVPCLQNSLYRLLLVVYQVHRPLITSYPSGLGNQGSCKVYQALFTGTPQQVPSLPVSQYRSLLIRKNYGKMEKTSQTNKNQIKRSQPTSSQRFCIKCMFSIQKEQILFKNYCVAHKPMH